MGAKRGHRSECRSMTGGLIDRLREEWRADLGPFGASASDIDAGFDDLVDRHGERHRRYHTIEHVATVLRTTESLAPLATDLAAVRLAAWYHDIVYDPEQSGNEARSAVLAAAHLTGLSVPADTVQEVVRLIELTAIHQVERTDRNGAVLMDADLWILGVSPDRYDRYRAGVRAEYSNIDDRAFDAGRAAVLRRLLAQPHIYCTRDFRAEREPRARWNLERELDELSPT